MAENKTYRLYDSLEFFWKKKVWFIIIPVILALLGYLGAMVLPKDGDYVGKSTIFTGSVKLEALTNPEHIEAKYGQNFSGPTKAFVPTRSYIKVETYGNNKEELTKELTQFNDQLLEGLMTQHDKVIQGTEAYAQTQSKRVENLTTAIKSYQGILNETVINSVESNIGALLSTAEMDLTNALATEQRVRNDIITYEQPAIANTYVVETKSYGLEGAIAGFILGILAAILTLSLWKYILEARGSKRV